MKKQLLGFIGMLLFAAFLTVGYDSSGATVSKSKMEIASGKVLMHFTASIPTAKISACVFHNLDFAEFVNQAIRIKSYYVRPVNYALRKDYREYDIAHVRAPWYQNKSL